MSLEVAGKKQGRRTVDQSLGALLRGETWKKDTKNQDQVIIGEESRGPQTLESGRGPPDWERMGPFYFSNVYIPGLSRRPNSGRGVGQPSRNQNRGMAGTRAAKKRVEDPRGNPS